MSEPPLLLLHGLARHGADFAPILASLGERWSVAAPDHRGHGSAPRAASYFVRDYAEDAAAFVGSEPVVVLGHSLGAMVALSLAAMLPEKVRAVILEDPPFHTMGERIADTPYREQFIGMQRVARAGGDVGTITDGLAAIEAGGRRLGELRTRESLRMSAGPLALLDPEVFTPVIAGRWLDGFDHAALAAQVRCPALVLQGDAAVGGALGDDDVALLRRSIRVCEHVRFSGTGHLIHHQQPAAMVNAIHAFLRR